MYSLYFYHCLKLERGHLSCRVTCQNCCAYLCTSLILKFQKEIHWLWTEIKRGKYQLRGTSLDNNCVAKNCLEV